MLKFIKFALCALVLPALFACDQGDVKDVKSAVVSAVDSAKIASPKSEPPAVEPDPEPVPDLDPVVEPEPEPMPEPEPAKRVVTLSWQAPDKRENGDALTSDDIKSYEVVYFLEGAAGAEDSSVMFDAYDASGNPVNTYEITVGDAGKWNFAIAAYDQDDLSSALSDPVSIDVQ